MLPTASEIEPPPFVLKKVSRYQIIPVLKDNRPRRLKAAEKPWSDRDPAPWGNGDEDGENIRQPDTYRDKPGTEVKEPPASSPNSDLDLRASLAAAAADCQNPEAGRAMLAIEARLGEITQFMKAARAGAPPSVLSKLDVLQHIT